jgi:hypothetical protein
VGGKRGAGLRIPVMKGRILECGLCLCRESWVASVLVASCLAALGGCMVGGDTLLTLSPLLSPKVSGSVSRSGIRIQLAHNIFEVYARSGRQQWGEVGRGIALTSLHRERRVVKRASSQRLLSQILLNHLCYNTTTHLRYLCFQDSAARCGPRSGRIVQLLCRVHHWQWIRQPPFQWCICRSRISKIYLRVPQSPLMSAQHSRKRALVCSANLWKSTIALLRTGCWLRKTRTSERSNA